MSLMRGSLFAGALFAGALFGQTAAEVGPSPAGRAPAVGGGGGGATLAYDAPWLKELRRRPSPAPVAAPASGIEEPALIIAGSTARTRAARERELFALLH